MKPLKKRINAKDLDEAFNQGKDVTPYLDLNAAEVRQPTHRINVDIPKGLLARVDREAERIGVPRTSLIKIWIAERLEKTG
jgi:hypothetical protein